MKLSMKKKKLFISHSSSFLIGILLLVIFPQLALASDWAIGIANDLIVFILIYVFIGVPIGLLNLWISKLLKFNTPSPLLWFLIESIAIFLVIPLIDHSSLEIYKDQIGSKLNSFVVFTLVIILYLCFFLTLRYIIKNIKNSVCSIILSLIFMGAVIVSVYGLYFKVFPLYIQPTEEASATLNTFIKNTSIENIEDELMFSANGNPIGIKLSYTLKTPKGAVITADLSGQQGNENAITLPRVGAGNIINYSITPPLKDMIFQAGIPYRISVSVVPNYLYFKSLLKTTSSTEDYSGNIDLVITDNYDKRVACTILSDAAGAKEKIKEVTSANPSYTENLSIIIPNLYEGKTNLAYSEKNIYEGILKEQSLGCPSKN